DPLNGRVQCEPRRFQVAAARGDVRVIQEQLHRVEISAALQQTAPGFTPQVVPVEIHLRQLLAAAGEKPAVRSPMRPVADRAKPKRRAHLLIVLQALADLVAEYVTPRVRTPRRLDRAGAVRASPEVPAIAECYRSSTPTGRYTWAPAAWLAGP